jgi:rubrerythrin
MRPSLRHQIGERRHARRNRGGHRPTPAHERDSAAQRVRESGGPTDQASYACQCGYLFAASVSTTVECPHCGTPQAW